MQPLPPGLHGVLNVDKPAGLSSARVVGLVKRMIPRGTKIGHAGTLDPFATGVLLLLVGRATKTCEQLMGQRKGYEATIKFGATTPTEDPDSPETPVDGAAERGPGISIDQVRAEAAKLVGEIVQRPPIFSALKVGGRRAYELARKGQTVKIEPRKIMVYRMEITAYAWPEAKLTVECGRGTYVRSLARDLGESLGVGGYLTQLRRTFVGDYRVEDAVSVERLREEGVEKWLGGK